MAVLASRDQVGLCDGAVEEAQGRRPDPALGCGSFGGSGFHTLTVV